MTTIAYNHKDRQIAYDGRTSRGELIMSDSTEKMIERNGVKFILCGSPSDADLLINMYFGAKSECAPEANAFVIDGDKLFRIGVDESTNRLWKNTPEYNDSLGSGSYFALAAMDFGKSAEEAVLYASTRDVYTGGTIKVIDI